MASKNNIKFSHSVINIIFVIILLLGLLVSGFVYYTGTKIADNTERLINQTLPTYDLLRSLNNSVTEQERYLYEYYATEDDIIITKGYAHEKMRAEVSILKLFVIFGDIKPLQIIQSSLKKQHFTADEFVLNIQSPSTDWALARQQLQGISQIRLIVMPQLQDLIDIAQASVSHSEEFIVRGLGYVGFFVVFYGLVSLLITYSLVRAWKAYFISAAKSERLSLFPKRNPNPVISLDLNNKVTFSNPASDRYLGKLGQPKGHTEFLLSADLVHYQQMVLEDENIDALLFEYAIGDMFFECEMHWLEDQQQWDIHLTDITSRNKMERELEYRASHDPETGLRKRYELEKSIDELCLENTQFCFGVIEVRAYSQLVSSVGLSIASQVVIEVGVALQTIIESLCADNCEAFRLGEKNFALVSTQYLKKMDIEELVEKIEYKIVNTIFHCQYQVILDFGFTCFPEHGKSYTELHVNAMAALDKSARSNNKSYVVFDLDLGIKLQYEKQLLEDLKLAIENEHFELYFQPQLCLNSQNIVGAEVLSRWQRKGQWVSPAEFIPLAESAGLIITLGDWILKSACKKAKNLVQLGFVDIVIAVNISPIQFSRSDFLQKVKQTLKTTQLEAKHLELEITEGVIIYNEQATIETLEQLKKLGVKLSIDDFGTGYSSLSYLKKFTIDKLKIDQSFVQQIQDDQADQSIVRAIIELGRNLQLKLIAEGVEEVEQQNILEAMGCDEIQGYYFSKPLPENEFIQFIQDYTDER